MRKSVLVLILLCCGTLLKAQETNVQSTLVGTYYGKMPCADCKVIESELELIYETDTSGQFSLRDKYIGRQGTDMMSRMKGDWIRVGDSKKGIMVVLNNDTPDKAMYYQVNKDGSLQPLDQDMHKIETPFDCSLRKK